MMNGLCLGTCSSRGGREEYTPAAGGIHHRICVGEYLGESPRPPRIASSVAPYGEIVEQFLEQQGEMVAIFHRLRDDHGFRGSYSSVRRYVHRLRPPEAQA